MDLEMFLILPNFCLKNYIEIESYYLNQEINIVISMVWAHIYSWYLFSLFRSTLVNFDQLDIFYILRRYISFRERWNQKKSKQILSLKRPRRKVWVSRSQWPLTLFKNPSKLNTLRMIRPKRLPHRTSLTGCSNLLKTITVMLKGLWGWLIYVVAMVSIHSNLSRKCQRSGLK